MSKVYDWIVVGAGPAGIATVGNLLDAGVEKDQLLWLDPYFEVGDFGRLWSGVSSNTKVRLFEQFLLACQSFHFNQAPRFPLQDCEPEATCLLGEMKAPLLWVTEQLQSQCQHRSALITELQQNDDDWVLVTDQNEVFRAHHVVLATGAEEKQLDGVPLAQEAQVIPLKQILNESCYHQYFSQHDRVAVFGGSHSAVIALRHLIELPVMQVVNFHRQPLKYAEYLEGGILYDNTGLKGNAATWAKQYLEFPDSAQFPSNLLRVQSTLENMQHYLPRCNKVVYAVGFNARRLSAGCLLEHNPQTGVIAPGLYGVGIGFPEQKTDQYGETEWRVGLWKFMEYLKVVVPQWVAE